MNRLNSIDPTVAVIVPCLNEAPFIGAFLDDIFAMDFDRERLSVWVADGMSDDGCRRILDDYARREPRLHVLDNPSRTTACALNIAISASHSDIVLRVDVHTKYPRDYVSLLVATLQSNEAENVGALRLTANGASLKENIYASLISSPFANGGALWRSAPKGQAYVDTVYCGCFRRSLFEKIGLFDERMIRIEDREFNSRILANGGRILLNPRATCTYYPRVQFAKYMRWTFSGPFRLFYSRCLTTTPLLRPRNFAPFAFVLYHLALPLALWRFGVAALAPIVAYLALALVAAALEAARHRRMAIVFLLPPLFYLTHLVYGAGSLWGLIRSFLPLPPPKPERKFSH